MLGRHTNFSSRVLVDQKLWRCLSRRDENTLRCHASSGQRDLSPCFGVLKSPQCFASFFSKHLQVHDSENDPPLATTAGRGCVHSAKKAPAPSPKKHKAHILGRLTVAQ